MNIRKYRRTTVHRLPTAKSSLATTTQCLLGHHTMLHLYLLDLLLCLNFKLLILQALELILEELLLLAVSLGALDLFYIFDGFLEMNLSFGKSPRLCHGVI